MINSSMQLNPVAPVQSVVPANFWQNTGLTLLYPYPDCFY